MLAYTDSCTNACRTTSALSRKPSARLLTQDPAAEQGPRGGLGFSEGAAPPVVLGGKLTIKVLIGS